MSYLNKKKTLFVRLFTCFIMNLMRIIKSSTKSISNQSIKNINNLFNSSIYKILYSIEMETKLYKAGYTLRNFSIQVDIRVPSDLDV